MVTREQVEDFILAATLEMGSACDEDWVKECCQILRAAVPDTVPVTYSSREIGERIGNGNGGGGACYPAYRSHQSEASTYIETIVGPDGIARQYQCATVKRVGYTIGHAREIGDSKK